MISARFALVVLATLLALGCDPTTHIDQNFDSSLGADFVPPPPDAGLDQADAGTAGDAGGGG